LLTAGLVAVFALGIMAGPTIRDHWPALSTTNAPEATAAAPAAEPGAPAPVEARRPVPRAPSSSSRARAVVAPKKATGMVETIAVSMWEPELRDRVKAVLSAGTRPEIAAADFDTPEQFMTVAHAARNTKVPFVVLKDRVVNRGQSLAEAIGELKPELDAKAEVVRARTEAQSDLDAS
jgi:hypothetical protein